MKYVIANWKMYPTVGEAVALFRAIQNGLAAGAGGGRSLPMPIICPPFLALVPLRAVMDQRLVRLGAQNCHWEQKGPYTGEISPAMLRDVVDYVLVGHSERRAVGETDEYVAKKVSAVVEAGLVPIVFVGEDSPTGKGIRQSEERLRHRLSRVDLAETPVLVVYEPVWAIGAEQPAQAERVREVAEHLKETLRGLGAMRPEVLYGGTVRRDNVERFAALEVLDGVGATRGSLDAEEFCDILAQVARTSPGTS